MESFRASRLVAFCIWLELKGKNVNRNFYILCLVQKKRDSSLRRTTVGGAEISRQLENLPKEQFASRHNIADRSTLNVQDETWTRTLTNLLPFSLPRSPKAKTSKGYPAVRVSCKSLCTKGLQFFS